MVDSLVKRNELADKDERALLVPFISQIYLALKFSWKYFLLPKERTIILYIVTSLYRTVTHMSHFYESRDRRGYSGSCFYNFDVVNIGLQNCN